MGYATAPLRKLRAWRAALTWARDHDLGIVHAPDEKSAELLRSLRATASAFSEVLSLLPCSSGRARNARRLKSEAITHRGWSSPLIASLSMTSLEGEDVPVGFFKEATAFVRGHSRTV